jgi:hypothetical protein
MSDHDPRLPQMFTLTTRRRLIDVLIVAAGALLRQMEERSLEDWDGSICARISKESLATGD